MKITDENLVIEAKDVENKNQVFDIFANLLKENNFIKNTTNLVNAFKERESQMTTGLGKGIAIPHATSSEIKEPKILVAKLDKVDWKSLDKSPVDVAIAIVVPEGQRKEHFELLASISSKFIEDEVIEKFKNSSNSEIVEFLNNLKVDTSSSKTKNDKNNSKDSVTIVGVTTCTTGVAHTFMAAKAIEDEAKKRGWNVKVEKQGQMTKDRLTDKDIENADYVLIAAGKGIDNPERFIGKKVYETDVASPITEAEKVLDDLIEKASIKEVTNKNSSVKATNESISDPKKNKKKFGTGPIRHLLAGISYMIPFIAMAGITLGMTTAFGFGAVTLPDGTTSFQALNPTAEAFSALAGAAFTLYIPILAGFIANSIVGRHAIAPSMIVALALADSSGSILFNYQTLAFGGFDGDGSLGFFGAIASGYLIGYGIKWSETYTNKIENRAFQTMLPLLIIPIFWTIVPMVFFAFVGYLPLYYLAFGLQELVKLLVDSNLIWLAGMILGMMVCFDLGGPVNKMAMLVGVLFLDASTYYPAINGILAVAVSLPPMVLLFSLLIGRFLGLHLDETDQAAAGTASVMGFFGITEGAIPFAAKNPKLWIPSFMFAGAVGGAIASFTGVGNNVALWGGPIIYIAGGMGHSVSGVVNTATDANLFMSSDWVYSLLYFVPLIIGGLSGFFMAASLNKLYEKQDVKKAEDPNYKSLFERVNKKLYLHKGKEIKNA
ncbi:MAG: PTS sugar transporter subunit IIA [Mycoplasmataceae bacterium]|nr:PTS sugar transporter subunit IIA [Mycoplasmataceae bacterium]